MDLELPDRYATGGKSDSIRDFISAALNCARSNLGAVNPSAGFFRWLACQALGPEIEGEGELRSIENCAAANRLSRFSSRLSASASNKCSRQGKAAPRSQIFFGSLIKQEGRVWRQRFRIVHVLVSCQGTRDELGTADWGVIIDSRRLSMMPLVMSSLNRQR